MAPMHALLFLKHGMKARRCGLVLDPFDGNPSAGRFAAGWPPQLSDAR